MKYSIIVPVYKVESYIKQCVESIINQTHEDLEIIIVNDGSPDNCPAICDEFSAKDGRIKVIHQENKGLIEARKSGLRVATGDYACFVDGDDWLEPEMYERVNSAVEKYQPDCVITQFYNAFPDKKEKSEYKLSREFYNRDAIENEIFPTMLFNNRYFQFGIYPCCWTKVFKKEILEKYIYSVDSRIRLGEDIAFTYPCLMACGSLAFVDEPLYNYRINYESMTKAYDPALCDIYKIPYESLRKSAEELNVDLSSQLPYYLLYLTNFVLRNELSAGSDRTENEIKEIVKELISYPFLLPEIKKINPSLLPSHTRLLLIALKKQSVSLVYSYMKILKRFM